MFGLIFIGSNKTIRSNKMTDQNSFGGQRQVYQGNWKCSECGAEITELPFEPDGERPLFCRDCHRAKRDSRPQRQF